MDLVIRQQPSRIQFLLRANTTIQDVNSTGSFARLVGVKLRLDNYTVEVSLCPRSAGVRIVLVDMEGAVRIVRSALCCGV